VAVCNANRIHCGHLWKAVEVRNATKKDLKEADVLLALWHLACWDTGERDVYYTSKMDLTGKMSESIKTDDSIASDVDFSKPAR